MQQFTQEGQKAVTDIASRYGLSPEAVEHMLIAVNNGAGSMAQFNCPELGGSGQWMRGGMTMVGDMFNHNLKATVDRLCNELSQLLASIRVFPVVAEGKGGSNQWWPEGLGTPISSGSQNNSRYAVFAHRLAVDSGGVVKVYDTLDHQIAGVSQQQGSTDSLTFSTQYGTVSVASLPEVTEPEVAAAEQTNFVSVVDAEARSTLDAGDDEHTPILEQLAGSDFLDSVASASSDEKESSPPPVEPSRTPAGSQDSASDMLALIEKLAQLHGAGVLTDEEFSAKKSELLARI